MNAQPPNPQGYNPKLDEVCRNLYMDITDMTSIITEREWLKSLQIITTLNRFEWVLTVPKIRSDGVTDSEEAQLKAAVMETFQLRIPPAVKVALPIDFDSPVTTPAMAYTTLWAHFARPDPFVQEKLRTVV